MIEVLLDAGADPNEEKEGGWTPLLGAANQGYQQLVELLLKSGADPSHRNRSGDTALSIAERRGHTRICEIFRAVAEKETQGGR